MNIFIKNRLNAQKMTEQNQSKLKTNFIIHNVKNVDTFGVLDLNREVKKATKKMMSNKKSL